MTDPVERPALPVSPALPANGIPGVAVSAAEQVDGITLDAGDLAVVQAPYNSDEQMFAAMAEHFFLRVWNDGRFDLTNLIWSPAIIFHPPIGNERVVGREPMQQWAKAVIGAFSDLHFRIDDVVADGDRVVFRVTQTGRHTGDYFGIPPTGRPVTMTELFLFRASRSGPLGARIDEVRLVFNALDLMQQLRLFPGGYPPRGLLRVVVAVQRALGTLGRRGAPR
jgi:predicted ester cyclase